MELTAHIDRVSLRIANEFESSKEEIFSDLKINRKLLVSFSWNVIAVNVTRSKGIEVSLLIEPYCADFSYLTGVFKAA